MKFVKYLLIFLSVILVALILTVKVFLNEARPTVIDGKDAEATAQRMLKAVDKQAWDTLPYIKWSFRGAHHFVWDKKENTALIQWDDYKVHLDPDQIDGRAYKGTEELEGDRAYKTIRTAWSHWCNDMFWLSAPYKIKDKGVQLDIATDSDGKEGLLVTYASGGVTPGDSYLWFLDEAGLPTGYKMWVKIIPSGGVYFSWEDWESPSEGVKIATTHKSKIDKLRIDITGLQAGMSWSDLGLSESPIKL